MHSFTRPVANYHLKDCIILRKTATEQERELKKVREQLEESDMKTKRLISAFDIDIIPAPELRRRYGLLAGKLEVALERYSMLSYQLKIYRYYLNFTVKKIQQIHL